MEKVLITGGTGLIGTHLTQLLTSNGFRVFYLSRDAKFHSPVKTFRWDIHEGYIEEEALDMDHVIHLAGAPVSKYWTPSYKKNMIESRVESAALLLDHLLTKSKRLKSYISSSAIGYYGDGGTSWFVEDSPPGTGFLSEVCIQWEAAARKFETIASRVVIIRTGIVLATDGGMLPELLKPLRFGIAAQFGNGNQFYSWIHIDDLSRIYLEALKNNGMNGVYNAVATSTRPYRELMQIIVRAGKRRCIQIPVPGFALNIALDGFGKTLLYSARCSCDKIRESGFHFQFNEAEEAVNDLIG